MAVEPTPPGSGLPRDTFATTRWTMVVAASHPSSPDSDRALTELYQTYWYPLYVYVRRRGYSREDSEDLVQSFFFHLLKRNDLTRVSSTQGKFRAFLLASLKHFLANEWDKAQRVKRGGVAEHLSWDWEQAESRLRYVAHDSDDPEHAFDRQWALALLEQVIHKLELEWSDPAQAAFWAEARVFLTLSSDRIPYSQVAQKLGLEEANLRVRVHRLRRRYREILRLEIAHTLADPRQVEEEFQSLKAALSS
jgi:RNA polymerase sigma factor (sigma-70 family)